SPLIAQSRQFSEASVECFSRWRQELERLPLRSKSAGNSGTAGGTAQPNTGIFATFGDARCKIESGEVVKSREMYFAIYQALAEDERREGVFKAFPQDFFDLVIVDECHRGSAREESAWRGI